MLDNQYVIGVGIAVVLVAGVLALSSTVSGSEYSVFFEEDDVEGLYAVAEDDECDRDNSISDNRFEGELEVDASSELVAFCFEDDREVVDLSGFMNGVEQINLDVGSGYTIESVHLID